MWAFLGLLEGQGMSKREWFWLYLPLGIGTILVIVTPPAIMRLVEDSQFTAARWLATLGIIGAFWAALLYAYKMGDFYNDGARESAKRLVEQTKEFIDEYHKAISEYHEKVDELRDIAHRAVDQAEKWRELAKKNGPALDLYNALTAKLREEISQGNVAQVDLPALAALPEERNERDFEAITAALASDLENIIQPRFELFPRRKRGRPAGFIYPPGCDKGIPIKDALPELVRLQEAYERDALRQACKATPWGAVSETTVRGWLERHAEAIKEFTRNS